MVLCVALIGLLIYAERPIFTSAALDEPKCVIFCVCMKLWGTKKGRKLSSKENKRMTSKVSKAGNLLLMGKQNVSIMRA